MITSVKNLNIMSRRITTRCMTRMQQKQLMLITMILINRRNRKVEILDTETRILNQNQVTEKTKWILKINKMSVKLIRIFRNSSNQKLLIRIIRIIWKIKIKKTAISRMNVKIIRIKMFPFFKLKNMIRKDKIILKMPIPSKRRMNPMISCRSTRKLDTKKSMINTRKMIKLIKMVKKLSLMIIMKKLLIFRGKIIKL